PESRGHDRDRRRPAGRHDGRPARGGRARLRRAGVAGGGGDDPARADQPRGARAARADDARSARDRRCTAGLGARPLSEGLTNRNRELLYLVVVGLLTAAGFASVYIADKSRISGGSLGYAAFFFALFLAPHLVALLSVPCADPYVLPIGALLAAVGVTEIYRLGPTDAFRQGTWVVIGVA